MRFAAVGTVFLAGLVVLISFRDGNCQLSDITESVKKMVSPSEQKNGAQVSDGLKEALEVAVQNTVSSVSGLDGYYRNPEIKIVLPEKIRNFETILRGAGLGPQLDEFELSMNRAAETAAPEAESIFLDTIKQITFEDSRRILQGPDDAATQYFRNKTETRLFDLFQPIVQNAMSEVGVTNLYQQITDKAVKIPFVNLSGLDLNKYVTDNALEGMFLMMSQEEEKIRNDPQARITELLKDVFGKN